MEIGVRYIFLVLFGFIAAGNTAVAAESVGFKQIVLFDKGDRSLNVTVWYPTRPGGKAEMVGGNRAFVGLDVFKDSSPLAGRHPLVLLSHGYGGSWKNLNWLAGELARNGYVVAAPDHPGTTTADMRASEATRLWERPLDISHTLTAILDNPALGGKIDVRRIAVVGHSLGGWTAIELAGGRYSADLALKGCDGSNAPPQCKDRKLFAAIGIVGGGKAAPELAGNYRDTRVGAVITFDPGPASGFLADSLAAVKIPVLIYASGTEVSEIAARKIDSEYIAEHLPKKTTSYREIADATHFSFVQLCKPNAKALIEKESPGEGFVCRDGGTRSRAAIHRQVADGVMTFLEKAFPEP
ncbi:MAG: alpha/beta fold hydrolase [Rhizobiales bacterium]|nr:alpha/beta fold hydrolase [Hyphomicrobiales bacterium]